MKKHETDRQEGQSIILVAFLFVALILFTALAVDVTKAYYDRRTAQNAADAAALAAAQEVGRHLRGLATTDSDVLAKLEEFAELNGAPYVIGNYLDQDHLFLAQIGDELNSNSIPDGVFGVEATAYITAPTYFGGIIGLDGLPLDAEAAVEFDSVCYGGDCLLPIAVYAGGFEPSLTNPDVVDFIEGECYNLWDGLGGGGFGWLNWSNQGEEYTCSANGFTGSECNPICTEALMDPEWCSDQPVDMVKVGDEVAGTPGVQDASFILDTLDYYIDTPGMIARMLLYDDIADYGTPPCSTTTWRNGVPDQKGQYYVVAGFGAFKITGYRLSSANPNASIVRDDPNYLPETCFDYPDADQNGCCYYWDPCDGTEETECLYKCREYTECDYNTAAVNRITGVFVPWTEDTYETCDAVGNFWAPRLTR